MTPETMQLIRMANTRDMEQCLGAKDWLNAKQQSTNKVKKHWRNWKRQTKIWWHIESQMVCLADEIE